MPPFLSIFTRHMASRPKMYERHCASLAAQTCQDFEHVVVVDDVGRGFAWAQVQFELHQNEVHGDYVLMLDDDDVLATPDAVQLLKSVASFGDSDVIVFRANLGVLGTVPDLYTWHKAPAMGHVSGSNLIVKRELWRKHLPAFRSARYEADYDFYASVWEDKPTVDWLDRVLVSVQRISRGKGE